MVRTMLRAEGPQGWWPARTRFEVIVGAILTQNASWTNVEKGIANLRAARLLTPKGLRMMPLRRLARLLRPVGYFNVKARRLKDFLDWFESAYGSSLARMGRVSTERLRGELLAVRGIGPETADSILCYALDRPVFVVDAYTRRILLRHRWMRPSDGYEEVRALFERSLDRNVALYNEAHALIVKTGKDYCRPRDPDCDRCPLGRYLPSSGPAALPGPPRNSR